MEDKGPMGMLFDLSFTEFVTTRIIKVIFIIGIASAVIWALAFIIGGFSVSLGRGIVFLILSPVVFFLSVLVARIWCEILIVIFRIAENTGKLAEQKKA